MNILDKSYYLQELYLIENQIYKLYQENEINRAKLSQLIEHEKNLVYLIANNYDQDTIKEYLFNHTHSCCEDLEFADDIVYQRMYSHLKSLLSYNSKIVKSIHDSINYLTSSLYQSTIFLLINSKNSKFNSIIKKTIYVYPEIEQAYLNDHIDGIVLVDTIKININHLYQMIMKYITKIIETDQANLTTIEHYRYLIIAALVITNSNKFLEEIRNNVLKYIKIRYRKDDFHYEYINDIFNEASNLLNSDQIKRLTFIS